MIDASTFTKPLAIAPAIRFVAGVIPFRLRLFFVSIILATILQATAREYFIFFGTYTGAKSKGIYVSRFDNSTGKLFAPELAAETQSPSFLALGYDTLYAVGESAKVGDLKQGAVSAFRIERRTGALTLLNQQPSGGSGPCHLSLDDDRDRLLVANYGSGSVAALPIRRDGSLDAPSCVIQHTGSGVNPQRQAGPHAHCIVPDEFCRFALACDLGLDRVFVYRLDDKGRALTPNNPPSASVAPGSGPRHLVIPTHRKFVYVVNEMSSTITAFSFSKAAGALTEVQTISTLPEKFEGKNTCAEIAIQPPWKFLYASNRGHDSIAVFSVDRNTGRLTAIQHVPTQGKTPRHFAIDPSGRWLLAENQNSDNVVVFRIDQESGRLEATGAKVEVPSPVCAVFLPQSR